MSQPAKDVPEMDLQTAISSVAERCLSTGKPASEIVQDADLDTLTDGAFRELARRGWISEVNNYQHRSRSGSTLEPADKRLHPPSHPISGRNPRGAWRPLDIPMQGADGVLKRLAEFDRSDVEFLRSQAAAQEVGWSRRRLWAVKAAELFEKNKKAKVIQELPSPQVEALSVLAKEAWS